VNLPKPPQRRIRVVAQTVSADFMLSLVVRMPSTQTLLAEDAAT
jgi:hypothetical protein